MLYSFKLKGLSTNDTINTDTRNYRSGQPNPAKSAKEHQTFKTLNLGVVKLQHYTLVSNDLEG